jgi:hypothetical protein
MPACAAAAASMWAGCPTKPPGQRSGFAPVGRFKAGPQRSSVVFLELLAPTMTKNSPSMTSRLDPDGATAADCELFGEARWKSSSFAVKFRSQSPKSKTISNLEH